MCSQFEQSCFDKEVSILKLAAEHVMTSAMQGAEKPDQSHQTIQEDAKKCINESLIIVKEGISKLTHEERDLILAMHLQEQVKKAVTKAVIQHIAH